MSSEVEQRRASSARLAAALEAYLDEQPEGRTGMLGDWVVIGSEVRVDGEGDPDCQYFVAMAGGSMLQHHVLGLLQKAEDVLVSGNSDDD